MYYYRARFYDFENGRFASLDPLGFRSGDSNLYRYSLNNSPNLTDPTGTMAVERLSIGENIRMAAVATQIMTERIAGQFLTQAISVSSGIFGLSGGSANSPGAQQAIIAGRAIVAAFRSSVVKSATFRVDYIINITANNLIKAGADPEIVMRIVR